MHEAKTHLSRLVEQAAVGEAFVICKAGRPLVRITALNNPLRIERPVRRLGLLQDQCSVPDDFDQLEAGALTDLFEGSEGSGTSRSITP